MPGCGGDESVRNQEFSLITLQDVRRQHRRPYFKVCTFYTAISSPSGSTFFQRKRGLETFREDCCSTEKFCSEQISVLNNFRTGIIRQSRQWSCCGSRPVGDRGAHDEGRDRSGGQEQICCSFPEPASGSRWCTAMAAHAHVMMLVDVRTCCTQGVPGISKCTQVCTASTHRLWVLFMLARYP